MKLLRGLRREVTHGGVVPHGWQMAWYEPRRRTGVYYPRPLNWLLQAVCEFIYRVQLAVHAPRLECAQGVYEAYDVAGWLEEGPEPGKEN